MTDAELAILSLVAEGPRHGYEIQQEIEERGLREWTTIGFSSVYYILNKLEREGLLGSRLAHSERGPSRRVYFVTAAGSGILQTAVADLLSIPRQHGSSFALGLANMHVLRPQQVRTALDQYEDNIRTKIRQTEARQQARQQAGKPPSMQVEAIFAHSLTLWRAELAWLEQFRAALEDSLPPNPAPAASPPPPAPADDPERTRISPKTEPPMNKQLQAVHKPKLENKE